MEPQQPLPEQQPPQPAVPPPVTPEPTPVGTPPVNPIPAQSPVEPVPAPGLSPAVPPVAPVPEVAPSPQVIQPTAPPQPPSGPAAVVGTQSGTPATPATPVSPAPFTPVSNGTGKKKLFALIGAAITAIVVILLVFFLVFKSNAESSVGANFLTALKNKDYAAMSTLFEPDLKKIAQKAEKASKGAVSENDVYKSAVRSIADEITVTGKPKATSVKVSSDGGAKHAVVVFDIGNGKKATVLEVYSDGKPYVLDAESDERTVSTEDFKSEYQDYKDSVASLNEYLDEVAADTSGSAAEELKTVFEQ